jgi:hypothetical protein
MACPVIDLVALDRALADIVAESGAGAPGRIGDACLSALPVHHVAITVMADADRQEPIWASDEVASHLDEVQFTLGEGPCVEALTERRPVLVTDVAALTDARWPMFVDAVRQTPVRALYVFPLQAGAVVVGVLNLYRDESGLLERDELAGALRIADAALLTLLGMRWGARSYGSGRNGREVDPHGWLSAAPLQHTAVYQATGMIIAQLDVAPETALAKLRAFAFVHDRPIAEVAGEVIARRLRFDEEEK